MRVLLGCCVSVLAVLLGGQLNVSRAVTLIVFSAGDSVATAEYPVPGTLRQAILDANGISGPDFIAFEIPGNGVRVIELLSCLPVITDPVEIDGFSQPGSAPNSNGVGLGDNAVRNIAIDASLCGGTVFRVAGGSTTLRGLSISGASYAIILGGGDNRVEGCYIRPNNTGVRITSSYNVIGGLTPERRNVITGCTTFGITDSLSGNVFNSIQGNLIGLDESGTVVVPPQFGTSMLVGVGVQGTSSVIGDSSIAGRNVIVARNGIGLYGFGNHVMNNFIGTNVTGTTSLVPANNGDGISVTGTWHVIGGVSVGNVIAGHKTNVALRNCANVVVSGNYIGTDASGTVALGDSMGLFLSAASGCTIGGAAPEAGNLISGHDIGILTIATTQGARNVIRGNFIGTDLSGYAALPNGIGVEFYSLSRDSLGGPSFPMRNLISGNTGDGVLVTGFQLASQGTPVIQGNYIGTDASGEAPLPNGRHGVHLEQPAPFYPIEAVSIGGSAPGAGNRIAGNGSCGIRLSGLQVTNARIEGNRIGVELLGEVDFGNGTYGVCISGGANGNVIGGSDPASGNVITSNGEGGVFVENGLRNKILRNKIFLNTGLGIDLAPVGVTANDPLDVDGGPNALQNFPVITSVDGPFGVVEGELHSLPNMKFTLDFFASDHSGGYCDPSGKGEGQRSLGSTTATTNASGLVSFVFISLESIYPFDAVTATATDSTGNTSEFSACGQNVVSNAGNPGVPGRFTLHPNTPNPFNPATTISYDVPEGRVRVNVSVFDVTGRLVITLVDSVERPGRWSVSWDGRDRGGQPVSSGVYFCHMKAGTYSQTQKMLLLK